MIELLKAQLRQDEGFRSKPYKDTVGKLTIGFGRNLDDNGITTSEAEILLENDALEAMRDAKSLFCNFDNLPVSVKVALSNMAFNLGRSRLASFKKFRAAIERADFDTAASEAMDSLWARQVKKRAEKIAEAIRNV